MKYSTLLEKLNSHKEKDFAEFQRRLISTPRLILGVRTPILRKIAKECQTDDVDELLAFPNDCYEIVFVKLAVVASLPYDEFVKRVPYCVSLMDNWALCDCFKAKCIKKHREDFLSVLEEVFLRGEEFDERYPLVALLYDYIEEEYLGVVEEYLKRADTSRYYVHMAAAWLTAEILVRYYDYGLAILKNGILDRKTHNKAIQKALESYRLTEAQKEYLRSLKIK